jgi:hypothetical protein
MQVNMDYLVDRLKELVRTDGGITKVSKETGIDRSVLEEIYNERRYPSKQVSDRLAAIFGLGWILAPRPQSELTRLRKSVLGKPRRHPGSKTDSRQDQPRSGKRSDAHKGNAVPRSQDEDK